MIVVRRAGETPWSAGPICSRCLSRLVRPSGASIRFQSSSSSSSFSKPLLSTTTKSSKRQTARRDYFSANGVLDKSKRNVFNSIWRDMSTASPAVEGGQSSAAHEALSSTVTGRHIQFQQEAVVEHDQAPSPTPRRSPDTETDIDSSKVTPTAPIYPIPLDASSKLSTRATKLPPTSIRRLMMTYLSLSKPRLTFLVVLTATSVYTLYPIPTLLLPSATTSPSLSALTLIFLTTGTAMCAASANALNMLMEPAHDAKMSRTRNRPLVRGLISPRGALLFAVATGVLGISGLYIGVNPTVSFLGAANIFLYAGIYTPMKRFSVLNTWAGAVVGAIPPLMGWAAAAGQSASGSGGWREILLGEENVGGWLFAALLFAWQFPHFNALSWTIRNEYKQAGYIMMAWVNEARNGRVAFRYALLFFPICMGLSLAGVTDPGFVLSSSVVNAWVTREAWRFWRLSGRQGSARSLFWAGVWQLPALMVLAMVHKKGLWDGAWQKVFGGDGGFFPDEEDEADWIDDRKQDGTRSVDAS